jgi:hypothetical protein
MKPLAPFSRSTMVCTLSRTLELSNLGLSNSRALFVFSLWFPNSLDPSLWFLSRNLSSSQTLSLSLFSLNFLVDWDSWKQTEHHWSSEKFPEVVRSQFTSADLKLQDDDRQNTEVCVFSDYISRTLELFVSVTFSLLNSLSKSVCLFLSTLHVLDLYILLSSPCKCDCVWEGEVYSLSLTHSLFFFSFFFSTLRIPFPHSTAAGRRCVHLAGGVG